MHKVNIDYNTTYNMLRTSCIIVGTQGGIWD